ncbi:hypothetical protein CC1G_12123 [Coprinopsis cinerea okayama7|uniref:Uncharacterized protein n=1 Tax=Coprinopsis cinerea (strain Okayama-7 / 130 / ATCC MYA-4618 / FGSC 9003) TaxID=240176 RepID=A8PAY0_COPC7|nr:hypothetical protein CC1G_12123 [Coprinopsis cinerea okayama7\|eukprot:XP_001840069.1 hypothetical protein CC1G_12123 [Coprinopsis cinerea okayama7\
MDNKWALIPEQAVLDRYYDSYGFPFARGWVPEFKEKLFKYNLVPLTPPEDGFLLPVIHRYPNPDPDSSGGMIQTPTAYPFPFKEFLTITSHIHPNFVVFHLGRTIQSFYYRGEKFVQSVIAPNPVFRRLATGARSPQEPCSLKDDDR